MKTLIVLGSTGSIGTQTLDVAERLGCRIAALTAHRNIDLLEQQIRRFHPEAAVCTLPQAAEQLRQRISDTDTRVLQGEEGIGDVLRQVDCDMVVNGIVGMAGTRPTFWAVAEGHDVALANKETIVTAGEHLLRAAEQHDVRILSVDSEHSAIFQCLDGHPNKIKKILLTASGGPFFGMTREQLRTVTKQQALQHPNWSMGAKITIDSATLMNKGLEVIEAARLFSVQPDQIEVVIHRQSIIHSAVEFEDNAILAQLGTADMRVPIQYAITYPHRQPCPAPALDLVQAAALTFDRPDADTFKALRLAYDALACGGTAPTVLNAANEVAVAQFLADEISFCDIADRVEQALQTVPIIHNPTLEQIFETDAKVRADQKQMKKSIPLS